MTVQIKHESAFADQMAAEGLAAFLRGRGIAVEIALAENTAQQLPAADTTFIQAEGTAWHRKVKVKKKPAAVLSASVSGAPKLSQKDRILEALQKEPMVSDRLAKELGIELQSIYATLSSLKRSLDVDKGEDGLWRVVK